MKKAYHIIALLAVMLLTTAGAAAQSASYKLQQAYNMMNSGQYLQAAKILRPLADAGNTEAQYYAAWLFHNGKGVNKSAEQALKYGKMAANKGNKFAAALVGQIYMNKKDNTNALAYYKKAAAGGLAEAYYNVGIILSNDNRQEDAFLAWLSGAEEGDENCMFQVAKTYYTGSGDIPRNYDESMSWIKKALAKSSGYTAAQVLEAELYLTDGYPGKDESTAFRKFKALADAGDDSYNTYTQIAIMYLGGIGTEKNETLGVSYLKKAYDMKQAGHSQWGFLQLSEPEIYLGICYRSGIGVTKDTQKAISYLEKDNSYFNNGAAMIAEIYFEGEGNVAQNLEAAAKYAHKVIDHSATDADGDTIVFNPEAYYVLGKCCIDGVGGEPKNEAKGMRYITMAAENGHDAALDMVNKIESEKALAEAKAAGFDNILQYGISLRKSGNNEQAVRMFRMAMAAGQSGGQTMLAEHIRNGRGVEKNPTQAYVLFKGAAEKGDPYAMAHLADMLWNGEGTTASRPKAKLWAQKSAAAGNAFGKQLWAIYSQFVEVGDRAHGGIVCYVDKTGKHGLVVSARACAPCSWEQAANWARTALGGGHLPSVTEAKKIMEVKQQLRVASAWHWTSSQAGTTQRYCWGPNPYFRTMNTNTNQRHPAYSVAEF